MFYKFWCRRERPGANFKQQKYFHPTLDINTSLQQATHNQTFSPNQHYRSMALGVDLNWPPGEGSR
jgi:hypothetical protein